MASLALLREERLKKLARLEASGRVPYPVSTPRDYSLAEVVANFSKLEAKKKPLALVGRLRGLRRQGALIFFDLDDGTARFQALVKADELPTEAFDLFAEAVDLGDFVGVRGSLFLTKKAEPTILVKDWWILAKSLRPLPDKWHGLQDVEERWRRRYLDLLVSPEAKAKLERRFELTALLREFYNKKGYLEVETPVLQVLAGGATAEPFTTNHRALGTNFHLRIAQELWLKKLLVAGFNKVYEIGRVFRNEGIDTTHNPEFTMLESQETYADATSQRAFVEELFKFLVKRIGGKETLTYAGENINFSHKFAVVSFLDLLQRHALLTNPLQATRRELELKASQFNVPIKPDEAPEKIMDNIYKKICRPKLIQPTFIIDYPAAFNPFAKRQATNPELIDRFQLVVGGMELVNAFSELNNPIEQATRYLEQDKKKSAGETEISPSDQEYLEAMEYGMPPNGGVGIGLDRLAMLFTDSANIREVLAFPLLKPL